MNSEHILTTVRKHAAGLAQDLGLELVDVQYRREAHGWVLRIFIDSEQGITVDDCSAVSRELSAWLDVEDLIEHAYHLEVSSPGLDRPLTTTEHFVRFAGQKAKIKLEEPRDGRKAYVGIIDAASADQVTLMVEGAPVHIDFADIATARLSI